jgi:lipopolysaccharide transport system permease protein
LFNYYAATIFMDTINLAKTSTSHPTDEHWTEVIQPTSGLFDLRLAEVWRYRDLLMLMVRRDIVSVYKQTILGPIWFVLQPILTTITFMVIFGNIAGISTDGMPSMIFYLAGITLWN